MCDDMGVLRIENLVPAAYTVQVKGRNTLGNIKDAIVLEPGPNFTHMGLLRAGDANGDDRIDILDFSLLRAGYGTADPRADFDNSGLVDILDFSLLRVNFGLQGPIHLP